MGLFSPTEKDLLAAYRRYYGTYLAKNHGGPNVVILSKSSFSFIPAALNRHGIVVCTPFWKKTLPGWEVVDSDLLEQSKREIVRMNREKCQSGI